MWLIQAARAKEWLGGVVVTAAGPLIAFCVAEFVLTGYFCGKRNAEEVLLDLFPDSGVILRPGFIHGTRMVGSTALPLGLVGEPLEKVRAQAVGGRGAACGAAQPSAPADSTDQAADAPGSDGPWMEPVRRLPWPGPPSRPLCAVMYVSAGSQWW